jgi:hypothetical protein
MRVLATSEVVRVMGIWVRRADAGLAEGAARNAATRVADRLALHLEEARTLRDLNRLRPAEPDTDGALALPVDPERP